MSRYKSNNGLTLGFAAVAAAAFFSLEGVYIYGTGEQVTFTVDSKERVTKGEDSKYLIFTKEGEVFEDTDSLLRLKFNSSDVYGQLRQGQAYNADVYGWRIPFLSNYRNIISVTPVNPK